MSNKERIYKQLRAFKRRYWLARLIQGVLIFSGTGLVFFALVALFEYNAWLSSAQRTALFVLTSLIELGLVSYYLLWPFYQLLIGGKALSNQEAARMVGTRIGEIEDRLLNILELDNAAQKSELIDAGLEQKSGGISHYDFRRAFQFKQLRGFALFLLPVIALSVFMVEGNRWHMLRQGADRLVNFNIEYQRSLPFTILIGNDLLVNEGDDVLIEFTVEGDFIPNQLELVSKGQRSTVTIDAQGYGSYQLEDVYNKTYFSFLYDEISSKQYIIDVIKRPVVGRVTVVVIPPKYTSIQAFEVQNTKTIEAPAGSNIEVQYAFKNTDFINVFWQENDKVGSSIVDGVTPLEGRVFNKSLLLAKANNILLHELNIDVIKDKRPELKIYVDSTASGLQLSINANDDYEIKSGTIALVGLDEEQEIIELKPERNILNSEFKLTKTDLESLAEITVTVRDQDKSTTQKIELSKYKEKEQTTQELLESLGSDISNLKEDSQDTSEKSDKKNKTQKQKREEAKRVAEKAEKLAKKDSAQFERLDQLSKDINELLEKMDKKVPEAQKRMLDKKLEEKLEELEKEWMILKVVDELNALQDSLKKEDSISEEQMKQLEQDAKQLNEKLDQQEKQNVDWDKFDELKKNNEKLAEQAKAKEEKQGKTDDGSREKPTEEEKKEGDDEQKESKDQKKASPSGPKQQMQEDSEALKEQLSLMSSTMMMEAMEKNIQLLRRLELRALKASKKQENVYTNSIATEEYDKKLIQQQTEVKNSAKSILDSLSALNVSDPMLGNVLIKNERLLEEHLGELNGMNEMRSIELTSKQRYLQYSLNDLASILYDILKSENQNMQNMMAGNKACNKPKPGKGKKKSLSQMQKEMGEKMGKMKKPGKGKDKDGRQTLSNGELLELIKGQEEILEQYKQKGGQRAGDGDLEDELNKQLDDLINNNIDKAIERNKDIEDKLIAIEKSENQKKEDDKKRKSQENTVDYDSIRNTAMQEYLKKKQTGSGVVNLPALKNYYSGKWILINQ